MEEITEAGKTSMICRTQRHKESLKRKAGNSLGEKRTIHSREYDPSVVKQGPNGGSLMFSSSVTRNSQSGKMGRGSSVSDLCFKLKRSVPTLKKKGCFLSLDQYFSILEDLLLPRTGRKASSHLQIPQCLLKYSDLSHSVKGLILQHTGALELPCSFNLREALCLPFLLKSVGIWWLFGSRWVI